MAGPDDHDVRGEQNINNDVIDPRNELENVHPEQHQQVQATNRLFQTIDPHHAIPDTYRIITLHELKQDDEEEDSTENTILVACLIGVKYNERGTTYGYKTRSTSQHNPHKELKLSVGTGTYRQLFMFADIFSGGKCFYVIKKGIQDETIYWHHGKKNFRIGDCIAI